MLNDREKGGGEFLSPHCHENLYFHYDSPSDKSKIKKRVIFLHDIGGYHGRYLDFGNSFSELLGESVELYYLDMPGHGLSSGARAYIESLDNYCIDLGLFIANLQESLETEIILNTHGMGGIVAIKLYQYHSHLFKRPLDGIILSNPAFKFNWQTPTWLSKTMLSWKGPMLKMKLPMLIESSFLTEDEEKRDEFEGDPLVSDKITLGLFKELSEHGKIVRTSSYFLDIPILILISENNDIYSSRVMKLFSKGLNKDLSKICIYENEKHDLFNGLKRKEVCSLMANWLKSLQKS